MENFDLKEINNVDLITLGLKREDIENLPLSSKMALKSGNRTTLVRLKKVNFKNGVRDLDAKLSLVKTLEGKTELRLHPVKKYAENSFKLSNEDADKLKSGQVKNIPIIQSVDGKDKSTLVFYDKDINEYVGVDQNRLNPPEKINGVALSDEQKNKMRNGEAIYIDGLKVSIDPTTELGIKAADVSDEDIERLKSLGKEPKQLQSIEFKHSKYNMDKFAFDALMCMSGLGAVVLIGHIADLLLHTYNYNTAKRNAGYEENANDNKLKEGIIKAFPEMKEKFEKHEKLTPKELQSIIENHLERPVVIEHLNKDALKPENIAKQEVVAVDKNATKQEVKQGFQKVNEQTNISSEQKKGEKEEIKRTTQPVKTTMKY